MQKERLDRYLQYMTDFAVRRGLNYLNPDIATQGNTLTARWTEEGFESGEGKQYILILRPQRAPDGDKGVRFQVEFTTEECFVHPPA